MISEWDVTSNPTLCDNIATKEKPGHNALLPIKPFYSINQVSPSKMRHLRKLFIIIVLNTFLTQYTKYYTDRKLK